jgi:hypothetical protein
MIMEKKGEKNEVKGRKKSAIAMAGAGAEVIKAAFGVVRRRESEREAKREKDRFGFTKRPRNYVVVKIQADHLP